MYLGERGEMKPRKDEISARARRKVGLFCSRKTDMPEQFCVIVLLTLLEVRNQLPVHTCTERYGGVCNGLAPALIFIVMLMSPGTSGE